jgi:hypothetical protein
MLLGVTKVSRPDVKPVFDKGGKVTDVKITATITVRRAVGKGKWNANNTKAIHDVETANETHEHNHRRDFEGALKNNFGPDFSKDLIGKTKAEADKAIAAARTAFNKEVNDSIKALDAVEGTTFVTQNPDGTFTVDQRGN